jgi:hypothetical protein
MATLLVVTDVADGTACPGLARQTDGRVTLMPPRASASGLRPGDELVTPGESSRCLVRAGSGLSQHLYVSLEPDDNGNPPYSVDVLPREGRSADEAVAAFRGAGCAAYSTSYGLVAVDVPPVIEARRVLSVLERGQRMNHWHFDLGVAPFAERHGE